MLHRQRVCRCEMQPAADVGAEQAASRRRPASWSSSGCAVGVGASGRRQHLRAGGAAAADGRHRVRSLPARAPAPATRAVAASLPHHVALGAGQVQGDAFAASSRKRRRVGARGEEVDRVRWLAACRPGPAPALRGSRWPGSARSAPARKRRDCVAASVAAAAASPACACRRRSRSGRRERAISTPAAAHSRARALRNAGFVGAGDAADEHAGRRSAGRRPGRLRRMPAARAAAAAAGAAPTAAADAAAGTGRSSAGQQSAGGASAFQAALAPAGPAPFALARRAPGPAARHTPRPAGHTTSQRRQPRQWSRWASPAGVGGDRRQRPGAGQGDPAARGFGFDQVQAVGRAGRQAQAALHARSASATSPAEAGAAGAWRALRTWPAMLARGFPATCGARARPLSFRLFRSSDHIASHIREAKFRRAIRGTSPTRHQ